MILGSIAALAFSAALMEADLDGTWTSECVGEGHMFIVSTLTVAGGNLEQTSYGYSDEKCATPNFKVLVTSTAQYGTESLIVSGAKEINDIMTKMYFTATDANSITHLNKNSFCGFSDWT